MHTQHKTHQKQPHSKLVFISLLKNNNLTMNYQPQKESLENQRRSRKCTTIINVSSMLVMNDWVKHTA